MPSKHSNSKPFFLVYADIYKKKLSVRVLSKIFLFKNYLTALTYDKKSHFQILAVDLH